MFSIFSLLIGNRVFYFFPINRKSSWIALSNDFTIIRFVHVCCIRFDVLGMFGGCFGDVLGMFQGCFGYVLGYVLGDVWDPVHIHRPHF